jgi:hypothetical protein
MIRAKVALTTDPLSYERLRQQILRRDGWRCPSLGQFSELRSPDRRGRLSLSELCGSLYYCTFYCTTRLKVTVSVIAGPVGC